MPTAEPRQWTEFLQNHPDAHFLQTPEWGRLKSYFGWEANALIVGDSGAQILFRQLPLGFTFAYIGKPSPAQITASEAPRFWAEVDALCQRRRAIACKFEPDLWVDDNRPVTESIGAASMGATVRRSPHNVQPRRTIMIDLRQGEQEILQRMKPKCRYNIRLAEKKGVTVRPWGDIDAFHAMLVTTGHRDAFPVHVRRYYRRAYELFRPAGMCELLLAEYGGEPLAALMVFARGRTAWYVYGGSSDRERERMPNHLLQWAAIRWAKARGCQDYDLWGVPDLDEQELERGFETRNDGLWGVYRFKRGFGGRLLRAVQAVDRIYRPLLYRLYILRAGGGDA